MQLRAGYERPDVRCDLAALAGLGPLDDFFVGGVIHGSHGVLRVVVCCITITPPPRQHCQYREVIRVPND